MIDAIASDVLDSHCDTLASIRIDFRSDSSTVHTDAFHHLPRLEELYVTKLYLIVLPISSIHHLITSC